LASIAYVPPKKSQKQNTLHIGQKLLTLLSQSNSTHSTNCLVTFAETDYESGSDRETLFVSARKAPTTDLTPKKKDAPAPIPEAQATEPPQAPQRPTTGGKQISEAALKAYLETLAMDESSNESSTSMGEADAESAERHRSESPVAEEDQCHWVYQVKRKSWKHCELEEKFDWVVCGDRVYFTSLNEAHKEAGIEVLRERGGMGIDGDTRHFSKELDENDMAHYYVEIPHGFIRVKVDRFLRNRVSGQLPTSKVGWLRKKGWDVMQKTTTKITLAALSPFQREINLPVHEDLKVVKGVFTIMDEANREAGDYVLDQTTKKTSSRYDDVTARSETQKYINGVLDGLQRKNEAFSVEWEAPEVQDGDMILKKKVEVWVELRWLTGPRNI
jgi:hypothetical protein